MHVADRDKSVFKMPPSPEVDAAWDYISMDGLEAILVSSDAIRKSGKDPKTIIPAPASWAGANDRYPVQIDVFHQIHCLDSLRRHVHKDYYFKMNPPTERQIEHRDHCLHVLLESVRCNADAGIIPHYWVYREEFGRVRPEEDWNIMRKCKDFDAVLRWAREHAIPDFHSKWKALEPGEDS
ncbi:hypothetical protein NQ176_g6685 [Zarea fungicola]|uniref:Uncharacterized protein n=1 Tax=Zarea fungicola TaxID=93591 RepID=A0ACC1N384_9HYPO|nr:hypothetical protein NQ176_g6685 [Lecanicillium fungicola]